jgi:hypothetical protein
MLYAPAQLPPGDRAICIADLIVRLQLADLQGERLLQVDEAAFGGIPFDRRTNRQLLHGYFLFVHRFLSFLCCLLSGISCCTAHVVLPPESRYLFSDFHPEYQGQNIHLCLDKQGSYI